MNIFSFKSNKICFGRLQLSTCSKNSNENIQRSCNVNLIVQAYLTKKAYTGCDVLDYNLARYEHIIWEQFVNWMLWTLGLYLYKITDSLCATQRLKSFGIPSEIGFCSLSDRLNSLSNNIVHQRNYVKLHILHRRQPTNQRIVCIYTPVCIKIFYYNYICINLLSPDHYFLFLSKNSIAPIYP